jgi:hypothetical protein
MKKMNEVVTEENDKMIFDDTTMQRLKSKIIITEARNIKNAVDGDTAMVKKIMGLIEGELQ